MPRCARAQARMKAGDHGGGDDREAQAQHRRQGLAEVAPSDHPAGTTERGQCLALRELSVFSSEACVPKDYPAAACRLTQAA